MAKTASREETMLDTKISKRLSLVTPALCLAMWSCDPDPGPTAPEQVQAMNELVAAQAEIEPERFPVALPPGACDRMARPSVYAMFVERYTDYYLPVDVDTVWYEHDGNTYEAYCIEGPNGCTAWIAGFELTGPITVSAEHCEDVVTETVVVGSTADGCHVETQHMIIEVPTRGCLTAVAPREPPPPTWPQQRHGNTPTQHPTSGPPQDLTTTHHTPPPPPQPAHLVGS
jgi:hypothetical protein